MAQFKQAYDITMGHEGGYANNPLDTGGETYKGIARKHNPKWIGWKWVDKAKEQAKGSALRINEILAKDVTLMTNVHDFYKANYWDVIKLDHVEDQKLANKLFDISVNMGSGRSADFWQEALKLTNNRGKYYPDPTLDGVIGPKTIEYTNKHPYKKTLYAAIAALQGERFLEILRHNESQEVFANSWFSRV